MQKVYIIEGKQQNGEWLYIDYEINRVQARIYIKHAPKIWQELIEFRIVEFIRNKIL